MDESRGDQLRDILVTAVVTTYNRPEEVRAAIRSVVTQTYTPLEILVVEDGTDTGIPDWLRQEGLNRVKYIRHERNKGLAAARNTGARAASGDYVAYLDDDDEWKPERIAEQVALLRSLSEGERAKLGVVSCGVEMRFPITGRVALRGVGSVGDLYEVVRREGPATPSSTFLFPKSVLLAVGGFDETLPSSIDHDIFMSLAKHHLYGYAVPRHLVVNCDRVGRATMMTSSAPRIAGVKKYLDKWSELYEEWYGEKGGRDFRERYFAQVVGELAMTKLVAGGFRPAWEAIKEVYGYGDSQLYKTILLMRYLAFYSAQRFLPTRVINFLKQVRSSLGLGNAALPAADAKRGQTRT